MTLLLGKAHVKIPPQSKRVVEAPAAQIAQAADEDVEWVWPHPWDGSYVSGYYIVKAAPKE